MSDSKIAVVTFERNIKAAKTVANHINGEIIIYEKGVFGKLVDSFDVIVAMFATGIAIREIVPYITGKWKDPALVVVDSGLNFAIPVLGGHHGGNEVAKALFEIGIQPVITTATEVHDRMSVEGIAKHLNCDIKNKYSTIAVNSLLLDEDVKIIYVKGPKIAVVDEDVSVLVRKKDDSSGNFKYFLPDENNEIDFEDNFKDSEKENL